MAIPVRSVLNQARNRHPAFHKRRVPDVVVLSYLSDVQSSALTEGAELDPNRVALQCSIAFAVQPANAVGVVGAGTPGGLPGQVVAGNLDVLQGDAGPAIEVDVDDSPVLVPDIAVSSATALTLTRLGMAWGAGQFINAIVAIVAGLGTGQQRVIINNTGTTLTISNGADGQQWATVPDATSVFRVVAPQLESDQSIRAVTELPPKALRRGYLISLDANGVPYINLSIPLEVIIDVGIPLPPHERVIGGSVRTASGSGNAPMTNPLTLRTYKNRYLWGPSYTAWLENDQLFLAGTLQDWTQALSIDLRLVPSLADFTSLDDVVLLPDFASQYLVAEAAHFMAMRCAGQPDTPTVDVRWFEKQAEKAHQIFLAAFGASARAQASYIREVW